MNSNLHFGELHSDNPICDKNNLFENYIPKCYKVKRILISFNCFSEYFYRFQKVHKHSLIQNELVSTFIFKKYQTILVSLIIYIGIVKKSYIRNTLGCIFIFKGPYLRCKNSLLG